MEAVLLEGDFSCHPNPDSVYHVTITTSHIAARRRQAPTSSTDVTRPLPSDAVTSHWSGTSGGVLGFGDVTGCECQRGQATDSSAAAYVCVYAYPHRRKALTRVSTRKRVTLVLTVDKWKTFEENFEEGLKWKDLIVCLAKGSIVHNGVEAHERKLLVLVNPFSGPGEANKIYQQRVLPMFSEARLQHHVITTERAGHAWELAKSLDLDEWSGIIIVSGDGLIYEAINGLMEHADWRRAIRTPIGCVPGGSGNALCSSLLRLAGEPYMEGCVVHATYAIIKHTVRPLDLAAVDTPSGRRLHSFLAISWGFVSDVDIESEKYRRLGNARFSVGAVVRIANLRRYRGRLSFVPADKNYRPKTCRNRSQSLRLSSRSGSKKKKVPTATLR